MLPQRDFRVHAGESDMPAVILTGTGAVHLLIILMNQRLPPLMILPYPVLKSVTDCLLFLFCEGGFLGIEDAALLAVRVLHGVVNTDVTEVQAVLQNPVRAGPIGAVGGIGGNVVI
ncbi:hypothetical protein SDC9_135106 [bioreactor metagenome]|uniref:Uncharacterized protein n=1 Tax=bioreactor metagenome TaxID=1076179 RepID=A0A645DFK9_9ZZZZ